MQSQNITAHLDPWLAYRNRSMEELRSPCELFLFGFSLHHHRLLGLSWIRSSSVHWLETTSGRAVTSSGSYYSLGCCIQSVADLDLEGRTAWKGLVEGDITLLEERWLGACKAARWLRLELPALDEVAISEFETDYLPKYLAWRAGLADQQGQA